MPNVELVGRLTDLTAGWLLTYLVHSTVILLACWAITSIRGVSDTVREILWKSAVVGGLLTASVQTMATREPLGGQLRLASRTRAAPAPEMHVALRSDVPGASPRVVFMRQRGTRWTTGLVALWLTA